MATNKLPRIYLDACYYIDVVRGRHSKLDDDRVLHIPFVEKLLVSAMDGEIEIWASTNMLTECLTIDKDDPDVPEKVQNEFKRLLEGGRPVKMQAPDIFIVETARSLRWKYGVKCGGGADTVHIATALELGCQEFITTNKRSGPLNTKCAAKLGELGLRVINATQTAFVPPEDKTLFSGTGI